MGLSQFPSAADGLLPSLVMGTVFSVAQAKSYLRSVIQVVGGVSAPDMEEEELDLGFKSEENGRETRVFVTQFKDLGEHDGDSGNVTGCCVCLCGFEGNEEVSELVNCKHFFHKGCLEKWFDNEHRTCPLCRSVL